MTRSNFFKSLGALLGVALVAPKELFAQKKDDFVTATDPHHYGVKNNGAYKFGVIGYDEFDRESGIVIKNEDNTFQFKTTYSYEDGVITLPDWVKYIRIVRTSNPTS